MSDEKGPAAAPSPAPAPIAAPAPTVGPATQAKVKGSQTLVRVGLGLALGALALTSLARILGGHPQDTARVSTASAGPQTVAASGAEPSVNQLEALAAADEAKARALEAQAGQPASQAGISPVQAAPVAAANDGGSLTGAHTLGAGDETLNTGQYYKAIPIPMAPGDDYQVNYTAHGYTGAIIVLDPSKQPFSQTVGGPHLPPGQALSTEIQPDKAGQWYVVLTSQTAGAAGTFEVNIQKITHSGLH